MAKSKYIISKIDNNYYSYNNGQFNRHLRSYNLTYKDYYEIYESGFSPICAYCLQPRQFNQKDSSYTDTCGKPKCVGKEIHKIKSNWSEEKKELDRQNKKKASKKKTKKQKKQSIKKGQDTQRMKFGGKLFCQTDDFKRKTRKTKKLRHGDPTYNNSKQSAEKNRNKSKEEKRKIREKKENTNQKRHGTKYPGLLNCKKTNSSNGKIKNYILPSGKIIGIRGYENIAIDLLLKTYTEKEIIIHDSYKKTLNLTFEYICDSDNHKYFPDIYIPKENKIIEIKRRWWYDGKGDVKYKYRLDKNLLKKQIVAESGYTFKFWIFDDKKNLEIL